jgi:ketosteroid isomerase-like protein
MNWLGCFSDCHAYVQARVPPSAMAHSGRKNPMKRTSAVGVLCLLVPLLAYAQDSSRVIAMENAWNQAELHNDGAAVELLLADDFVMTVAEGTVLNKTQIVASVKDKSYHPDVLQSTDIVVHPYGNTAIVTGAYHEKGVDKGKPWERRGRFTDTWIYMNGRWQCVASHFSVKPK